MNRRPTVFRVIPFVLAFANLASAAPGPGGPAVGQAELDRLARLSTAEQRNATSQGRIQRWFFDQAGSFQDRIRASALGRSALVSVGPPSRPPGGLYSRTFAAPAGTGAFVVLFTDNVTTSSTFETGSTVEFGRSTPTIPMDGGSPSACWHESMHALLTGVPLGVRVEDYSTVAFLSRNNYRREAQEHVYLELFAEKAAAWIGTLGGFEREAAAAVELLDELKSRGRTINYEVEQFAWAKARAEWQTAWDKFGKFAIRLPAPVRDEFERPTSTRFPSVEEVIGFYMAGDFKGPSGTKAAGKAIQVPKWVMWPGSAAMPVLMEDQDRKGPELKAGVWSAAFGVRFSEPRWRDHPRVTRGVVTVTLRSDDPSARIDVSYAGRTIAASSPSQGSAWRRFVVKLGGPGPASVAKGEEPVRVTVTAKDSVRSASSKEPVLPVHVLYRDDPPPASPGKASGAIYLDTEGIFLVKLPSGAPSHAAPASSGQSARPAGGTGSGTVTVPRGGAWVFSERKIRPFGEVGLRYDMRTTLDVSDSGGLITVEYFDEASIRGTTKPPKVDAKLAFRFSWNAPPPLLVPDVPVTLVASASDAGSVNPPDTLFEVGHSVSGFATAPGARLTSPSMIRVRGVRQLAAAGTLTQAWTPPRGRARDVLSFACMVNQRDQGVALQFIYAWVEAPGSVPLPSGAGPSAPPPPATGPPPAAVPLPAGPDSGSIEAQLSPPRPLGKALDETPPAPGELDGVVGGTTGGTNAPEAPEKPEGPRWYVHPLNEYRIRLGRGWNQVTPGRIDGMDQIENAGGPWLLFPSRKRALTKRPSEEMERLAADWMSEGPSSRRVPFRVAGEPALAVGKASRDGKTPIAFWHVVLSRKDRLFYLSAFAPASTGFDRLPAELVDLLSTLEFLPGSPAPAEAAPQAGPGRADVDALMKRAVELHDAKSYADAVGALDRVLALDPGSAEAWRRRGMAKRELKDLAGAVADLDESIRLEPAEPTAWAGRGLAKERAGDADGAQADYSRAVELDPGYRKAWGFRATLRLKRKDYRGAASDFDVALRLDPPRDWAAWAHGARGLAREKLGDLAGAREDYREALALGSTDDGVRQSLKRVGER